MISFTQSFRNKVQLYIRYRFVSFLWLCLLALIILKLYLLQQKLAIVYVQQQKYLIALMKRQLRSKTNEKQQRIHLYDNLRKIYQMSFKIVLTYPTECQESVYVCSSSALLLIKIMYPYHSLLIQHIKRFQNTISALFIFQEFGSSLINYNLTTFGLPKCSISDNFIQQIVKILVAKIKNRSLDTANDYVYQHTILQSQFYLISCGPISKVNNSRIFAWICTMNPFQVISSCQKTQNKIIHTLQESTVLILQQDKSSIFSSTKKSQSILKQKLQSSGIIQTQLTQEILIKCFNKQNELQLSISEQLQLKTFQCSLYGPQQLIRKILFGRFITNIQSVYYQNHPKYFSKVSQLKDTYYVKSNTTTQKYLNSIAFHGLSDIEYSSKFMVFSIFLSVLLIEVSVFVVKWYLVPGINQAKRICKISKSSMDWSLCEEQIQTELAQNSTMIFQKLISYYSKFIWLRAVSQENGVEVRQSILKKGQKLFPQQQFQLATLYIYQELITLTSQQISYLKLVYHLPSCQLQIGSFNNIPTFNHILSSHLDNPHSGRIKFTAKPSISKNQSKSKRIIILNGVESQSEVSNESSQGKEVDLISRTNYVETTLKHILEEKESQVYAGLTSLNYLRSQNTLHRQETKQKLIGKSKQLIQQKIIGNYQKIINQYDKIIDIKTKIYGQNPTTISINSIFELKAKKAKCTYKLLKKMINNDIQIEQNCLQTYLPQQNDQHQQDILVSHLQYYHLFRMKTKCLLGIPISYKQLENLTFSQSNFIKLQAIYLLVQQLLKNKPHFDLQAVMLISQSLILNSSTNSYKYKMLNIFADCLANFEILDSQLSQIKLIRQFYNFKHRKFYFIADLSEGLDQLTPTLGVIYEEMGKLDLMSVFNLTGQKDGMLFVSEIIRPKRKDAFIALMEQLSLMKVHTEGKTTRKSLKQQYNFKKILNFITEEKTMFTKIIVLILGEGYTSNSILTEDAESLSNQKQLQQLIHAQITHEINQSYAHFILIGHQLNYYHTKFGKLKKYIKSSQHLLEIDLMQTDFSYHITQIHQFLHP